ncbi:MAG: hypothetical protein GY928_11195 [Colwellia sp.]|nr:hypothetical protein [Colwellia sp.]
MTHYNFREVVNKIKKIRPKAGDGSVKSIIRAAVIGTDVIGHFNSRPKLGYSKKLIDRLIKKMSAGENFIVNGRK